MRILFIIMALIAIAPLGDSAAMAAPHDAMHSTMDHADHQMDGDCSARACDDHCAAHCLSVCASGLMLSQVSMSEPSAAEDSLTRADGTAEAVQPESTDPPPKA